jgi:CRISPR-associated protein Cst1
MEIDKFEFDFSQHVGDPIVETGRLGLINFCKKDRFESLEELEQNIKKLFNVYVFKTSGRIGQIFSSNSKFTHNSTGKDLQERLRQSLELYKKLTDESLDGSCIVCGKKDNLCSVNKTILPLTSGNSNVNFTSNFSNQFLACKECMTSLFFAPTNMQKVAGRMTLIISNNPKINHYLSKENNSKFESNIIKNIDPLVDSKTNIFANFIYETIEELQEIGLFGDITFYLISNVDKGSDVEIAHINENQIRFLHQVAPKFFEKSLSSSGKSEWNHLIYKYSSRDSNDKYRTRSEGTGNEKITIKFEDEVEKNKNYRAAMKYFNPLINSFIQGKSLLGFFKKNRSSWHLTEVYLKEIKGMREERLEVLKSIADKLQTLNEDDKSFFDKTIFPIEKTKSQNELRGILRILMKKFLLKYEKTLFTADEMVFQILPYDGNWQETKDILLIALYEKLTIDEELKEIIEKEDTNIEGEDENG